MSRWDDAFGAEGVPPGRGRAVCFWGVSPPVSPIQRFEVVREETRSCRDRCPSIDPAAGQLF